MLGEKRSFTLSQPKTSNMVQQPAQEIHSCLWPWKCITRSWRLLMTYWTCWSHFIITLSVTSGTLQYTSFILHTCMKAHITFCDWLKSHLDSFPEIKISVILFVSDSVWTLLLFTLQLQSSLAKGIAQRWSDDWYLSHVSVLNMELGHEDIRTWSDKLWMKPREKKLTWLSLKSTLKKHWKIFKKGKERTLKKWMQRLEDWGA